MDVPVPMSRVMTQPNIDTASYDSLYMANVGQVKFTITNRLFTATAFKEAPHEY